MSAPDDSFSAYQTKARETAMYTGSCIWPDDLVLIYPTLGLCGEAGEAADIVKKAIRDNGGAMTPAQKLRFRKELGDVLWYLSNIASDMGWKLEEIASENLEKLADRQKRGVLQGSGDDR